MKTSRPDAEGRSDDFDAVELAAAEWLARREFGLSKAETAELQRWLQQDRRHGRVFAELQKTAEIFDRNPGALAAAGSGHTRVEGRVGANQRRGVPRAAGWIAIAAALAVGTFVIWRLAVDDPRKYQLTATTAIGEMRSLTLPDGTTAMLNTDSTLAVRYSQGERRVRLTRGEARFTVAKNAFRPFFVEASGVAVRAVGTDFVVRLRTDAVDILVTEGRVRVENSAADNLLPARNSPSAGDGRLTAGSVLSAGEQVNVPVSNSVPAVAAQIAEVTPEQIARTLAWQDRRLMFEGTPLSEVVVEFNRYSRHKLVIDDATLGRQKFGGTFHHDRHETLISLLEQSFDVVAERRGETTYLRRRSAP